MKIQVAVMMVVALLVVASLHAAEPPAKPATPPRAAAEEFNGPFAGWNDLKTDFGAKGDGKADDTAALKAGLEALAVAGKGKPGDPYVLYLPAGTYRITAPLVWENRMGIAVLGEDPATTKILYDGPPGQTILTCNGVSYSKFGRITWDGQGKARAAVAHQWNPETIVGPAVTYMEHADEVFQDVGRGIIGGAAVPVIIQKDDRAHVVRGGSWHLRGNTQARYCRPACRRPGNRDQSLGFRVVVEAQAAGGQQAQPAKELALDLGGGKSLKLVLIPAGKFLMGSPANEKDRLENEGPQHEVTISKPFYMGIYPVTQEQYKQVLGKYDGYGLVGAQDPAVGIFMSRVVAWCKAVSEKTGRTVRLPTEAEWEYACRAGTTTRFPHGDDPEYVELGDYAWYDKNSAPTIHPVGQKKPNPWGLYDMLGNVYEWCSDYYVRSYGDAPPAAPRIGSLSHYNHGMDAETLVKRCKFIRCSEAGLSIESFNALDWWVWDSEFVDCGVGATNCAEGEYGGGHFHLYRCLFRGSKVADIRTGHTSYFGIRFNTSIGSRRFVETVRPKGYSQPGLEHPTIKLWGAWTDEEKHGSQMALQGNRILNPTDPTPIWINQHPALTLVDNIFAVTPVGEKPVVEVVPPTDGAQCISIGNKFFGANRVAVKGELTAFDNETLDYAKADLAVPALPAFAPRVARRVFELPAGAKGEEIQKAIDEAATLAGQKPVVHLPAGRFPVSQTLRIPAGADVQLVGDGVDTVLIWEGENEGTMLKLAGPARATLRDFRIAGIWNSKGQKLGRGIVAENVDQPGSQILLDQALATGCTQRGLVFDGLRQTRVESVGSGASGISGPGIIVNGAGDKTTAWVGFFGASGANNQQTHLVTNGGNLVVWDTWYETAVSSKDAEPRYIHLTDRGNLTFFNGHIATLPGPNAHRDLSSIDLDGFVGRFTLIGAGLHTLNPQLRLAGNGQGMKALVLGTKFDVSEPWLDNQAPAAELAVLACRRQQQIIPSIGKPTPEFLRAMLQDARTVVPTLWQPAPAGATDLRLHRVSAYVKIGEGMVFKGGADQ